MMKWEWLSNQITKKEWDDQLCGFEYYNLFQSYGWGEYKRVSGWEPHRLVAKDETGQVVAMMQGMLKTTLFKTGVFWVAGGPLGDLKSLDDDLILLIKKSLQLKRLYFRISPHLPFDEDQARLFIERGLKPCDIKLWTGISMVINPCEDEESLKKKMTKNWRHNLNRSAKYHHKISLWENPDLDQILQVYHDMESRKGIDAFFTKKTIRHLYKSWGDQIVVMRCVDEKDQMIGIRACAVLGSRALDLWAAVSEEGLKTYASYALFWELMHECRRRQIRHYDMGGVDPQENTGVYNFKKGTGAQSVKFLGEWDRCESKILKKILDFKIKKSGGVY